jgi:hypothetical protein
LKCGRNGRDGTVPVSKDDAWYPAHVFTIGQAGEQRLERPLTVTDDPVRSPCIREDLPWRGRKTNPSQDDGDIYRLHDEANHLGGAREVEVLTREIGVVDISYRDSDGGRVDLIEYIGQVGGPILGECQVAHNRLIPMRLE